MTRVAQSRAVKPPLRVMLVEDHREVRAAVRQAIEGPEIEVVGESGDGRQAVALAPALSPDVILLDIDLPDVSGIHVVRMLSAALPRTIIVMLTVSDAHADLFSALEAGARGYLVKGLAPSALRRALHAAVRGELALPRGMAGDVLSELVGAPSAAAAPNPRLSTLSQREIEVLSLLADGLTDREIGDLLTISTRTVEAHVGSILRKLDARNRAAATRVYLLR